MSDTAGVFVTLFGTDDSTCGERTAPCKTVQTGVNQAKLLGRTTVYIARGTYTESVTLAAGITLEGGWTRRTPPGSPRAGATRISAVTIVAPSTANTTISAPTGANGAGLRLLTVQSKATANPGESLYGVFLDGVSFTLDTVVVTVANGGDGAGGAAGDAGAKGASTCDAGPGTAGAAAGPGAGAEAGAFAESGYVAASGGSGSSDGGSGVPGSCVIQNGCLTQCSTCMAVCLHAIAGCGGSPGAGGAGGAGGGSSVAVFAWNATVTVLGGSFTAGSGGNGGNGGVGGSGGAGGSGGVSNEVCLSSCSAGGGCTSVDDMSPGIGDAGGAGGAGGQGGGGAGGDSYAFVVAGDAGALNMENQPSLQHGQAGTGGVVNGQPGQAGNRGP